MSFKQGLTFTSRTSSNIDKRATQKIALTEQCNASLKLRVIYKILPACKPPEAAYHTWNTQIDKALLIFFEILPWTSRCHAINI